MLHSAVWSAKKADDLSKKVIHEFEIHRPRGFQSNFSNLCIELASLFKNKDNDKALKHASNGT